MLFDFDGEVLTLATGNGFGRCQYKFGIQDAECAPFRVAVKASEINQVCSVVRSDSLNLSHVGNQLHIVGDKGHFKLACTEDFPEMPAVPSESVAELSAAELVHAMRATSPAVDENSEKFALGGVQLCIYEDGSAAMYATDGRRASMVTIGGASDSVVKEKFLIPQQAVPMISGMLGKSDGDTVSVYRDGTAIVLTIGGGIVLVTELAGRFPDVNALISGTFDRKRKSSMSVNVAELKSAIREATIGYDGNSEWANGVNIACDGGRLIVLSDAASANDIEATVAAADIDGTGCMTIDYAFLSSAASASGDDSVRIALVPMNNNGIAMTIEGQSYRGLIMGITMTVDDGKGKQVPTANALRCLKAMESGQLALV